MINTFKDKFYKIASRVIFPPFLLWDGLKLGMRSCFGKLLGKIIVPASLDKRIHKIPALNSTYDMTINHIAITTHDHAVLDGIEFTYKDAKKYIIYIPNTILNINIINTISWVCLGCIGLLAVS